MRGATRHALNNICVYSFRVFLFFFFGYRSLSRRARALRNHTYSEMHVLYAILCTIRLYRRVSRPLSVYKKYITPRRLRLQILFSTNYSRLCRLTLLSADDVNTRGSDPDGLNNLHDYVFLYAITCGVNFMNICKRHGRT